MFVIGISVIREGFEDIVRHREDKKANSIKVTCIKENGSIIKKFN